MTAASTNRPNQINFITPQSPGGKSVLLYLNKTCDRALQYCQNNNLKTFEDFARAIKLIGDRQAEAKGDLAAIRVGIKNDDLILSLANRPQLGTTRGTKMLEHLEDEDKFKFTRKRVEGLLQKETANSKSNLDSEEIAALELLSEDVSSLQDQDIDTRALKQSF